MAMLAAFLWGIASILLSPCHLSSIPLIIGFIGGQKKINLKKAFWLSTLFSLGILSTIILVGIITSLAGRMLGDLGQFGDIFLSLFFILFGLILFDIISIPYFKKIDHSRFTNKGYISAFIIGFIFGIGLGPCTFAFMAPMLAVVFGVSSQNPFWGILLLLLFALGHISIIILAGTFTEVVERYLNWNRSSQTVNIIRKVCGSLLILAGIYNLLF